MSSRRRLRCTMSRLKLRAIGSRRCVDAMRGARPTCWRHVWDLVRRASTHPRPNERAAERIVVGRAASSQPDWRMTEHGDRLIVMISVSRPAKRCCAAQPTLDVEVEGGTIMISRSASGACSRSRRSRSVLFGRRPGLPASRPRPGSPVDPSDRVPGTSPRSTTFVGRSRPPRNRVLIQLQ